MATVTRKCDECGKEYLTYFPESYRHYCSVYCEFAEARRDHTEDCPWHKDWHACNCGALDLPEEENE